jgi:hypothetical protein
VALVQSQGYVPQSCAMLLAKASERVLGRTLNSLIERSVVRMVHCFFVSGLVLFCLLYSQ